MELRIEFEWQENAAYAGEMQYLVRVREGGLGSSTSFSAENWPRGIEEALEWAGIDGVEVYIR